MGLRNARKEYQRSIQRVYETRLAELGFAVQHDNTGLDFSVKSEHCWILFSWRYGIPLVQRVPKSEDDPADIFDLNTVMEVIGSNARFDFRPMPDEKAMRTEVDRMIVMLLDECGPVLAGDDDAWESLFAYRKEKTEEKLDRLEDAGLILREGDDWRRLPELESVRANLASKARNLFISAILLFVPAAYVIFVFLLALNPSLRAEYSNSLPAEVFMAAIFAFLVVGVARKSLLCQFYWETSADGLRIGLLSKSILIPWGSIQAITVLKKGLQIRTDKNAYLLEERSLSDTEIQGSIWQHLNLIGKGFLIGRSSSVLSLWAEIPSELVDEIHWENPQYIKTSDLLLETLAVLALILGASKILNFFNLQLLLVSTIVLSVKVVGKLSVVRSISVSPDGMEAVTGLGRRRIAWESVKNIDFRLDRSKNLHWMVLSRNSFSVLAIPWLPDHPNSTRIMLAIVKRLREEERFKTTTFPVELLMEAHGDPSEVQ